MRTPLSACTLALALSLFSPSSSAQTILPIRTITANDAAPGDRFGTDVAIDGEVVVVGAWGDDNFQGSAYVLRGTAGDVFQEAKLQRSGGAIAELFGRSVAVSGETIAVGASRAVGAEGRVVVYENTSTPANWVEAAVLAGNDLSAGDEMGLRVDIDGDTIVAGAPIQAAFSGAAYVFRKTGSTWAQEVKLVGSGLTPNDLFGIDVCIDGNRVLVGACGFNAERGRVFVFERSSSGWTQADTINAQSPLGGDLFGISVAFDGGRAAIGGSRNGGGNGIGFVEVHRLIDGLLNYEATFDGTVAGSGYGNRVDVSGDFVVVSEGALGAGNVLLYQASFSGFTGPSTANPIGIALGDQHGGGVDVPDAGGGTILLNGGLALEDRILVSGARLADITPNQAEGRTFVSLINERYSSFCAALQSTQCGACPCGNAPPLTSLAGGCLNSDGRSATLDADGNAALSSDTLRLRVFNATSTSFALLQSGPNALPNQANPACPPGSGISPPNFDGLRCIGGMTMRQGSRPTDAAGNIGITNNSWGGMSGPPGGLLAQAMAVAGQTVYFQAFYRDNPALNCQNGINTTNGVRVLVTP